MTKQYRARATNGETCADDRRVEVTACNADRVQSLREGYDSHKIFPQLKFPRSICCCMFGGVLACLRGLVCCCTDHMQHGERGSPRRSFLFATPLRT